MTKTVRVHDDTHRALKLLKSKRRSASLDQVIREMIRETTGSTVEATRSESKPEELTKYFRG